jgi:hypothetical protein
MFVQYARLDTGGLCFDDAMPRDPFIRARLGAPTPKADRADTPAENHPRGKCDRQAFAAY